MKSPANQIQNCDPEREQQRVVDFLSSAKAYPTPEAKSVDSDTARPDSPSKISTHCAHIFLFDHYVYKIKRAVKYSYLDLSTLAARHAMCLRELALNHPVLPDIYLDVVPITQEEDGSLRINGAGQAIEWAVHMKRFSEQLVLDNLASQNQLDNVIAANMGRSVAEYHAALPVATVSDGHARIKEVVHELIHELDKYETIFSRARLDKFTQSGLKELLSCESLLNERALAGFIRRCHGDLHLRNMILYDGVPTPFDALEFDERMATTDILYDVAFLLMDLNHRGLTTQANIAFNQYILHSPEQNIKGLRLLPLFMFCRAGIRAMTTAQAFQPDENSPAGCSDEACDYLDLALKYLNQSTPLLVAVGGVSGTGKSTQATLLAPTLGIPPGALLLRSDVERKHSLGFEATATLPDSHYTSHSSSSNYAFLLTKAEIALEAGISVIVDAVFLDEHQRLAIEALARKKGVRFAGLWLYAPYTLLENRVLNRRDDASDATVQVLNRQLEEDCGDVHWVRIPSDGSKEQVKERVAAYLSGFHELPGQAHADT